MGIWDKIKGEFVDIVEWTDAWYIASSGMEMR